MMIPGKITRLNDYDLWGALVARNKNSGQYITKKTMFLSARRAHRMDANLKQKSYQEIKKL